MEVQAKGQLWKGNWDLYAKYHNCYAELFILILRVAKVCRITGFITVFLGKPRNPSCQKQRCT